MKHRKAWMGLAVMALLLAGEYSACRAQSLHAASVEYDGRRELTLKDGTKVILLPTLDSTATKPKYYYLPTNLHLSRSPDGTPQFLFLKFVTEKSEEQGGVSGALLHFLMEFGLSAEQKNEAQAQLRQGASRALQVWRSPTLQTRNPTGMQVAEIVGAAPVEAPADAGAASFQIISGTLTDKTLTPSIVTSGKAPLMPGEKIAAAARLSSNGAQLLAATLEKTSSIADVSISTDTVCYAMLPAVQGRVEFHASKISQDFEELKSEYSHYHKEVSHGPFGIFGTDVTDSKTYKENQSQIQFLVDKGLVKFDWNARVEGELATKLFDAFTQIFMATFTEKPSGSVSAPQDEKEGIKAPDPGTFNSYDKRVFKSKTEMTDRVWTINARLPVAIPVRMTANLRDWYDNVRDNPKCVASVNLNDPFFSHRDIKFIMDLDGKEIFDDTVNYVTVNVRKKRTTGRDFEDHITIDSKYLKDNGVAASVTYARGEDKNPDLYQYQAQWSLKGGNVYPPNPAWQQGSWEGVTLTPPVRPVNIEVEGDADDMKAKDVVRIAAQIHYIQFGKETETNIQVAPAKNSTAQKIFLDRDQRNYAYRLIYYHKTAGRLVGPWVQNVSDDYIYANIPDDLLTLDDYKTRAKGLANGVMEKILDKAAGAVN
jgi:hypothetical protein